MGFNRNQIRRMGFDDVQPIQRSKMGNVLTEYNGTQYKSKLEARIACLLDHWLEYGVITEWAYEPESMIFESTDKHGKRKDVEYIPDFRIQYAEGGIIEYWEAKGMVSAYDLKKWELFKRDNPDVSLIVLFAGKLRVGKKNGISVFKANKMERTVDRVWQELDKEFKKDAYSIRI